MLPKLALDTNVAAYVVEALELGYTPFEDLQKDLILDRIAAFRLYVYGGPPCIVPTVKHELEETHQPRRWKPFDGTPYRFEEIAATQVDEASVIARASDYGRIHRGSQNGRDCRIVAEAECADLGVLLTFDLDLRKALGEKTRSIAIRLPSEYWQDLNLPRGLTPTNPPAPGQVLAMAKWWRW